MHNRHSISVNYFMNTVLTLSSILFPLISFPYVSRVLGPEGVGRVSFAMSFISYFAMLAQLGIPTYGIRECAKLRDNKENLSGFVKEILVLNSITGIISYSAFLVCVFSIDRLKNEKILFLVMSSFILFNSIGMEWMYKGLEEYSYITIRSVIFKLIAFVGMFLIIQSEADVMAYGLLTIFASVGSNIFNLFRAKKYVSFRSAKIGNFKRHIKPIMVFFLLSIATTIYTNLDNVMLGFITNDTEVGFYTSAVKVKAALVGIVTSLGAVLLPRASYYVEKNNSIEFRRISEKALSFTFVIAIPLAAFFSLAAEPCILVLSGIEYYKSISSMIVLMPTVLLIGISNVLGLQILVPLGREKIVFVSVLTGAFIDFLINVLLIPKFGSLGASIGTTVAEFFVLVVQLVCVIPLCPGLFRPLSLWKPILSMIAAMIISFPIFKTSMGILLQLIVASIVFFSVYCCSLLILKERIVIEIKERIFHRRLNAK